MQELNWEGIDLVQVVAESAYILRQAMRYSDGNCDVKRWIDAKLLEALWCPYGSASDKKWLAKDVVRNELGSLDTPNNIWDDSCQCIYNPDTCTQRCDAGSLLARVLLGPMDWLFHCESNKIENPLLWVVAKLYDQLAGVNSYRTLSGLERGDDYRIFQLLYRIPEADYEWFTKWMVDFSALLRDTEKRAEADYFLICTDRLRKEWDSKKANYEKFQAYCVSSIISILKKSKDIPVLREHLALFITPDVSDQLSQRLLGESTQLYRDEAFQHKSQGSHDTPRSIGDDAVTQAFTITDEIKFTVGRAKSELEVHFYRSNDQLPSVLKDSLKVLIRDIEEKTFVDLTTKVNNGEVPLWKLANYFIWLCTLHPELGSYTVRYGANYRLMPDTDSGRNNTHDRFRNPCFVIASRQLPSPRLLAGARVSLTHCLGPLEDYYAIKQARRSSAADARADVGTGMFHNLRQYLHSLQKYSGALGDISRNMASSDAALVAHALSGTIDEAFRFQDAVFGVLTADHSAGGIDRGYLGTPESIRNLVASSTFTSVLRRGDGRAHTSH